MTKTIHLLFALALLGTTGGAARAQAEGEALRCEARKMRAESNYFGCLARCDRRAARQQARPVERRAAATLSDCEATCAAHFDGDLARIGGKPPCAPAVAQADPRDCEARLLRLSAAALRCQARCSRQSARVDYDPAACLAACETRCGTGHDELMADPLCAAGRIGDGDLCATH